MNGLHFVSGFKQHFDIISQDKKEDAEKSLIEMAFKFKKLAEYYERKTFAYRKFSHMLIQKSPEGKKLIDDEIMKIIDGGAQEIYDDPFKGRKISHLNLSFHI